MPPKERWLRTGLLAIVIATVSSRVISSKRVAAQQQKALASFSQSVVLGMGRGEVVRRCKKGLRRQLWMELRSNSAMAWVIRGSLKVAFDFRGAELGCLYCV
jgi:hypothetical protein